MRVNTRYSGKKYSPLEHALACNAGMHQEQMPVSKFDGCTFHCPMAVFQAVVQGGCY